MKLEEYDYKIIHKAGKDNTNTDALSQNPIRNDECVFSQKKGRTITKTRRPQKNTEEKKQQILYEYHDAPSEGIKEYHE